MADKEKTDQANNAAPAADIPNLKAKEKERKKAGAAWSGVKPGGAPFSGATGVARAAASAAGATGGATAGGTFGLSAILSNLAATMIGKLALGLAAALIMVGGAMVGYGMLMGGAAGGSGAIGDLGALSSSMKVRMGGGDRTGYVASKGEIMFDQAKPAAKPAEKAPEQAAPAGDAVPPEQVADAAGKGADWGRPGLEHNLSGSKLSSSMGGGFGSKNIMAGSGATKLAQSMGKFDIKGADKGRLAATKSNRTGRITAGSKSRGMKANKAFGQLIAAKGVSMLGAGASTAEGARTAAANAFDGQDLDKSNVQGGPANGTAPASVPQNPGDGSGAPDVTAPNAVEGFDQNTANTAAMIAAIAALSEAAGKMKARGSKLILIGIILCFVPFCLPAGIALIAVGMMMKSQAEQMLAMAQAMSAALASHTTDQNQNRINQYCIDQAYNGVPPANCNPPASVTNQDVFQGTENEGMDRHQRMINENGYVEGNNGEPTQ